MQIMDQFGAAPGAESVRMPDGTERTLAAEHAAAILVNEQPAFRVVCTPELLPQLALGRLLTEGWITSADEVERVAVCAQGLKISVQLRHPLAAAEQAGQEVPSCCTDNLTLASPVQLPPLAPGDVLLHGHTHIPAWTEFGEGNLYLNPGSVSIPKEGSAHSYMTLEGETFLWKTLEGEVYRELEL